MKEKTRKEVKQEGYQYMEKYIQSDIGGLIETIDDKISEANDVGIPKNTLYLDEHSYLLLRGYLKENFRNDENLRGMKIESLGKCEKRVVYISN